MNTKKHDANIDFRLDADTRALIPSGNQDTDESRDQSGLDQTRFAPGTRIDQYRLIRLIGRGGMGEVYLAEHVRLANRQYAVKFVKTDSASAELRRRFELEIDAMARLRHPNVISAEDAGEFEGCTYMAMEFVEGNDLAAVLRHHQSLSLPDASAIICQTLKGLQHAHQQNLVHRDLKPSNLLLSEDGIVKILDLGLARIRDEAFNENLTCSMQLLGTPDYMAPEQCKSSRHVDIRADIYSLGCTFYCLLCGQPPFGDEEHASLASKLTAQLNELPKPISQHVNYLMPPRIQEIVSRMLAKEPQRRYSSPSDVFEDLEKYSIGSDLPSLFTTAKVSNHEKHSTRRLTNNFADTLSSVACKEDPKEIRLTELLDFNHPEIEKNLSTHAPRAPQAPKPPPVSEAPLIRENVKRSPRATVFLTKSIKALAFLIFAAGFLDFKTSFFSDYIAKASKKLKLIQPESPKFAQPGDPYRDFLSIDGDVGAVISISGNSQVIDFELSSRMYCYLFMLLPTSETGEYIVVRYPEDSTAVPQPRKSYTVEFNGRDSGLDYYDISQHVRQVGFVLVRSKAPLPTADTWKSIYMGDYFPWRSSRAWRESLEEYDPYQVWWYSEGVTKKLRMGWYAPGLNDSKLLKRMIEHFKDRDIDNFSILLLHPSSVKFRACEKGNYLLKLQ